MATESFYVQQLFERLEQLKMRLLANQKTPTPLSETCDIIMAAMRHTLALYGDQHVYAIFELTVVPKIERLLLDAREQLRLQDYTRHITRRAVKGSRRDQLIALQKMGKPLPPPINDYRPIPTPEYNDETRALIEDALIQLKRYLRS